MCFSGICVRDEQYTNCLQSMGQSTTHNIETKVKHLAEKNYGEFISLLRTMLIDIPFLQTYNMALAYRIMLMYPPYLFECIL